MRLIDHTADLSRPASRVATVIVVAAAIWHAAPVMVAAKAPLPEARTAMARLSAAGTWAPADVRPVLNILERETRRFLDMPAGKGAVRTGSSLVELLTALNHGLSERLAAMRQAVFERDADVEALLATKPYHERETLALTALYNLSWARYRLSRLIRKDSKESERLLREAVRGFTEFVYVNEVPEVYGNCLYGRGLSFYALGEKENALQDLRAAAELGGKNPIHDRARAALDAVRRGKPVNVVAPVDPTAAELDRLRKLLRSAIVAGGIKTGTSAMAARRADAQSKALALARALILKGDAMAARVERLVRNELPADAAFASFLLAEMASDRGDHRVAREHYMSARAAGDEDAPRYRARSELGIAEASYRLADYGRAADTFGALLGEDIDAETRETALYFRFKAIEALRASEEGRPGATDAHGEAAVSSDQTYIASIKDYLDQLPGGPHAGEMRYRLAEAYRARGDCAAVLHGIDAAERSDDWEPRTLFIALQCHAEAARAAWRAKAPEAEAQYQKTLIAVRAIATRVRNSTDPTLATLGARASLVGALLAAAAPSPHYEDVIELTRDRSAGFRASPDLDADRIALRAIALAVRGRTDDARAGIDRLVALDVDSTTRRSRLREIANTLMRVAERNGTQRRAALLPLVQRAYSSLLHPGRKEPFAGGRGGTPVVGDLAVLGQVSLELGDLNEAALAYRDLLDRDPDSVEALRGVALIADARGQLDEARSRWQALKSRATAGDTLWYESTINIARIEERLGHRERACAVLREASIGVTHPTTSALASAYQEAKERICSGQAAGEPTETMR